MSNTVAMSAVSWLATPVSGWRNTAHNSRPSVRVLYKYLSPPSDVRNFMGVGRFQVGEADAQLASHPKRATLCTLPWLSAYSMSTGNG